MTQSRILVTGGTGVLGRQVVAKLKASGNSVRVMSRHGRPIHSTPDVEWAQADLRTGHGLAEAVADVQVIVHAASSIVVRSREVDVEGTQRLLELAQRAKVAHFVYISIVGIEGLPFAYYRNKVAAEKVIMASGRPWSILRTTQFYDLIDLFIQPLAWLPLGFLPTEFQFQPLDSGEVATELVKCVLAEPMCRLTDMGGPEIYRLDELARAWLKIRGLRRLIVPVPIPGKVSQAFRNGGVTTPQQRQGKVTWQEWLQRKYPARSAAQPVSRSVQE